MKQGQPQLPLPLAVDVGANVHCRMKLPDLEFDAEAEVDGFFAAAPAVDHGVLVEAGAGFEKAEGGRVPGELDVGAGEEGGGGVVGFGEKFFDFFGER